ncbi:threonylcarbamoyl-AMP synthase [Candidatus Parvarchaeota archaeon]|nr:threonylcarbamoyl-AMP synthase [Candidatus Parvarchaeota archaeon]
MKTKIIFVSRRAKAVSKKQNIRAPGSIQTSAFGLKEAAQIIKSGGLVAFPTETVYGLGANALDATAVRKIFAAKGRPSDNPLIVHIWSKRQIPAVAKELNGNAKKLIKTFFPGPLSLVLKKSGKIPMAVTAGLQSVCVRMPSPVLTRQFLKDCGVPIAAPSANLSGRPSPTSWEHVHHDLGGRIDAIIAGHTCAHGLESTVIDCTKQIPVLLRPGALSLEKIEEAVGKVAVPLKFRKALSPGMKYRHYSPKAKVVLVPNIKGMQKLADYQANQIIATSKIKPRFSARIAYIGLDAVAGIGVIACKPRNMKDYAKKVFSFFRKCDTEGIRTIYAQKVSLDGVGRALSDRLSKAAAKTRFNPRH